MEQTEVIDGEAVEVKIEKLEETPKRKELAPIPMDEKGLIAARDNGEMLRYCGALITSTMVPKRFDTPQKLFGVLAFVRSAGLPDTAIRQVAVIHGTPSLFGDLPLGMTQRHKDFESITEKWYDESWNEISLSNKNLDSEHYAAVCWIKRRGGIEQPFTFTLKEARAAGLIPAKPDAAWTKYPKIMLRYRARTLALKSQFADCISGLAIAEYDFDVLGHDDMKDVTNTSQEATTLPNLEVDVDRASGL